MGLIFMDGFDHYARTDMTVKWNDLGPYPQYITMSPSFGRNGSGVLLRGDITGCWLGKTIAATNTIVVGFAFRVGNLSAGEILELWDGATQHIIVALAAGGSGQLTIGKWGSPFATSANSIFPNTWYYIEVKVLIGDVGSYELRVNGTSSGWFPPTVADTRNGGNASVNMVRLRGMIGYGYYDDIYLIDATTVGLTDFLGDVMIKTLLPNDNGTHSEFIGSDGDGVDNYLNINEASLDNDTSYNYGSGVGQEDSYGFTGLSAITSVKGIQINVTARKDDAGTRLISASCLSGGITATGAAEAIGTTYLDYRTILENDPGTGIAWQPTGINAAEFGVKVVG